MTNKALLIEIAVEELPAIPFLKELPNIKKKWNDILIQNDFACDFDFFYTPRRLVFWHRDFKTTQDNKIIEQFGAPIKIAYQDNKPTKAAIGFAKKCGVSVEDLDKIDQGKGEVLYYKNEVKGLEAKVLLNNMINDFISKLMFGKSMRWGSRSDSFIRPIRGLSVVLGDELIDAELYGVQSSMNSFAHRMVSYDKFDFDFAGDYFCKIEKNGVILDQKIRKNLILEQMKNLELKHNIIIEKDEDLLNEIVAITEYPTALLGKFDEEFLELPDEVIIGSMKEHQRYFAIYNNDTLTNQFIVISNAFTNDFSEIISGNEKVLRPRLADGMFFWENDLKTGLQNEGLKKITFVEGIGSVYDKCLRENNIALLLADMFKVKEKDLLSKTIMMAKSDLTSDMVYEFTDLQGIMGYYYAKKAGEDKLLYTAIKEQYLPSGEDSALPSNTFSSTISLAIKIDTLMSLFSLKMIPTGSRDPFALRRAATGIVKICVEHKLNLDLYMIIKSSLSAYPNLNTQSLLEFFNDRLIKIYNNVNPSVIKAVISTKENNIYNIHLKINALNSIVNSSNFKDISTTFKRVANIIKDINTEDILVINEQLLEDKEEKTLYMEYKNVTSKVYTSYDEELNELFSLKNRLDEFFENVFVNHENIEIKTNRKNIIGLIYQAFKKIADIKEITI
jgi:glycyl-tRNA synthetase beta chain